jgi:hypothetical protein
MQFTVKVKETLIYTWQVEAKTSEEAAEVAQTEFENGNDNFIQAELMDDIPIEVLEVEEVKE